MSQRILLVQEHADNSPIMSWAGNLSFLPFPTVLVSAIFFYSQIGAGCEAAGNVKRKISAILAADISGYSRLVAENEEETIDRLAAYREVFNDFVTRCGGRIFNTAGDAVLAEFSSAVDAVRCAVDVQESFRTRNLAYAPSRHMSFRIGITIGDVIEREGDLLGDGVNIAARLEALAAPGGICVSRSVYEQVRNKISVTFDDIGEQYVKNIPNSIYAYVVALQGTSGGRGTSRFWRRTARRRNWLMAGAVVVAMIAALLISVKKPHEVVQTAGTMPKSAAAPVSGDASNVVKQADLGGAPGPFDGLWNVSRTGNEHCMYNTGEFRVSIMNGGIRHGLTDSGKVEASGEFHFTSPSRANPNLSVSFLGRLSGNTGEGTFNVIGTKCEGTIVLKL
jgi:class 3 adenylate cyclase